MKKNVIAIYNLHSFNEMISSIGITKVLNSNNVRYLYYTTCSKIFSTTHLQSIDKFTHPSTYVFVFLNEVFSNFTALSCWVGFLRSLDNFFPV